MKVDRRAPIIILLIVAILATASTRYWAEDFRRSTLNRGHLVIADSSQSLSNMSSYALALLLGGLRGPLVMMLWISSESQKADKNLQDFDTKVEWIRMLQPEFDSVHMFQIWNKAYNISVQMASLSNKYLAILDALDYADKVNRQRPDDINIILSIADVYFNKLGNSAEKNYYRKQVTQQTQWRVVTDTHQNDSKFHPTKLPPMLDAQGNILPDYADVYRYLKPYEPFPYGLSPFGIAYDYYRIAQHLQTDEHQQHLQISPNVIDSRPAVALENWATEEFTNGRDLEFKLFDQPVPNDPQIPLELQTAEMPLAAANPEAIDVQHLIFCYQRSARLAADSAVAYQQHLDNPDYGGVNAFNYEWHIDHNVALGQLAAADAAYIQALPASGSERDKFLEQAKTEYGNAIRDFLVVMLKWFTPDELLTQMGTSKTQISGLSNQQLVALTNRMHQLMIARAPGTVNGAEDRADYERYVARAQQRLALIYRMLPTK